MDNIKLSIIVTTYCHEQYVEQALRSIQMQQVDFPYEVLVGEDCSPDATAAVLRRLEPSLPDNFRIFYRKENLGEKKNNYDLQERSRGEYIIFLEGDDYWTSPHKLQTQVDFLDTHEEYIAVAHAVEVVDRRGIKRTDFVYPQCPDTEYTVEDFCKGYLCGQTASMMMRNFFRDKTFPLLELEFYYPGDRQKNFMLAGHGKVYSSREVMSAYRYVPEGGTSYSATTITRRESDLLQIRVFERMHQYALEEFGQEDAWQMELAYMVNLANVVRDRLDATYTLGRFCNEFRKCRFKGRILFHFCRGTAAFLIKKLAIGKRKTNNG